MPQITDPDDVFQSAIPISESLALFGLHPLPDMLTEDPGVLLATPADKDAACTSCVQIIKPGLPMFFSATTGPKHLHCWINFKKLQHPDGYHEDMGRLWFAAFKLTFKIMVDQADTAEIMPCMAFAKEITL